MRGVVSSVASVSLLSLAVIVSPAHAQDSMAFLAGDRETAAKVTRIVEGARTQGLPTEPIVAKAQEGVLFHAAPARIVAAAQAVAKRLETARSALAPNPTPA